MSGLLAFVAASEWCKLDFKQPRLGLFLTILSLKGSRNRVAVCVTKKKNKQTQKIKTTP